MGDLPIGILEDVIQELSAAYLPFEDAEVLAAIRYRINNILDSDGDLPIGILEDVIQELSAAYPPLEDEGVLAAISYRINNILDSDGDLPHLNLRRCYPGA